MHGCLACDLACGRQPLPGGRILSTKYWIVEHCIGSLGLGTLIVKPGRHVTHLSDLTEGEAAELGPLLCHTSSVIQDIVDSNQVYSCLWSHSRGVPSHIHYVLQPVTYKQTTDLSAFGPWLQVSMLDRNVLPDPSEVDRIAVLARRAFGVRRGAALS